MTDFHANLNKAPIVHPVEFAVRRRTFANLCLSLTKTVSLSVSETAQTEVLIERSPGFHNHSVDVNRSDDPLEKQTQQ